MPRHRKDQRGSKGGDGGQHGQARVPDQVHRIKAVRLCATTALGVASIGLILTGLGSACRMGVALAMVIGIICAVGASTR